MATVWSRSRDLDSNPTLVAHVVASRAREQESDPEPERPEPHDLAGAGAILFFL